VSTINTRIEGSRVVDLRFGSAAAKTITIQFGVKAPSGTYCVSVRNSATNRSYIAEVVIAAGEANTDVVKSVTIPGDVTGTWLIDPGIGLELAFSLMCGVTYQGAANTWLGTNTAASSNQFNFTAVNGNIFELFDVGLYEGPVAPPFVVPDYASELLACKRYWEKSFSDATVPFNNSGEYYSTVCTCFDGSNFRSAYMPFKVSKRINPTMSYFSPAVPGQAAGAWAVYIAGTWYPLAVTTLMNSGVGIQLQVSGGGTANGSYLFGGNWVANARL
jgi:hypothetical protein